MPCDPNALTLNVPPSPSGPAIPGFGVPFTTNEGLAISLPSGFPEDLLGIVDLLQLLVPSGPIKSSLSVNFGKDTFDGIANLMDKFFPVIMLYKMFLPILDIIICIIEVICALVSPFAVISKVQRLFRVCIPAFLAIFPIFAIPIMLLSLLFLILQLIEYIIGKILDLVNLLLENIESLSQAFQQADQQGVLAITRKLGLVICSFQSLFVLLVIFDIIIKVIKDLLKVASAIPPCGSGGSLDTSDTTRCCAPPTCPAFIKNNETISSAGSLQYFNEAAQGLSSPPAGFPSSFSFPAVRPESWQFYDAGQTFATAFSNITHAYDLPPGTSVTFFPVDANYTGKTPLSQVPYLVDLHFFYVPSQWGRIDALGARFVRINNCIVLSPPSDFIVTYNGSLVPLGTGVLELAGGAVFEDDNKTSLVLSGAQATLNSLLHLPPEITHDVSPILLPTDGYLFTGVSYDFKIQHPILFAKSLITLGCIPSVALDRDFVNTVFGGNSGTNFAQLNSLVLPDIAGTQQCLSAALAGLTSNISVEGVATFQATTTTCLSNLRDATITAIGSLLGISFDQYKSTFTVEPTPQFTSEQITVRVALNETNGQGITSGMPASLGESVAARITAHVSFGTISSFTYDGSQFFNAKINSLIAGPGKIQVFFDGLPISTATLPVNLNDSPSISVFTLSYTFVYSQAVGVVETGTGDTTGEPRLNNE